MSRSVVTFWLRAGRAWQNGPLYSFLQIFLQTICNLSPFRVERAFLVDTLVRMRAKIVPLRLRQILR